MPPVVSVIMAVHNGASYLGTSLRSILGQTLGDRLECVVVNDGSTDKTGSILKDFSKIDKRLRIVTQENNGLGASLNTAYSLARGRYLARMDADDICRPQRLERQVSFLNRHPETDICGAFAATFGAFPWIPILPPTTDEKIRCELLFNNPIPHPSVIMRRKVLDHLGGYDTSVPYAEDYELWARALPLFSFANYPNILLYYRRHSGQMGNTHTAAIQKRENKRIFQRLLGYLQITPTDEQLDLHFQISRSMSYFASPPQSEQFLSQAEAWLRLLRDANCASHFFPELMFSHTLNRYWLATCRACCSLGKVAAERYRSSCLAASTWTPHVGFALDCLAHRRILPNIPCAIAIRLSRMVGQSIKL